MDASNGWVLGDGGAIFHTSNGGTAWIAQTSPVTNTLYSVSFVDTGIGWVVGEAGTILKTTNGGATWMAQSSGITTTLRSVAFVDASLGWAVGNGGTILHTVDGGVTWAPQASGTTESLNGVGFLDAQNGWTVGGSTPKTPYDTPPTPPAILGVVLRTTDGGATWGKTTLFSAAYGVSSLARDNAWVAGTYVRYEYNGRYGDYFKYIEGAVLLTSNGLTWSPVSSTGDKLYGIAAVDPTHAWAVGEAGTIAQVSLCPYPRTEGQHANTNLGLYGVTFVDSQNGWAVGESGTILRYREVPTLETYEAQFVRQSFPAALYPGTQATAWIDLRNTGTATWYRVGANPVTLGTSNPQDRSSPFYTSGDWLSPSRPTRLDQESVAPGEIGRFSFTLTAPAAEGTYREYFRPVA
ncbi:MAG: YCF48-related protein, partial [Dehalococcoidia bacterium]|nr:YCF48-related protein [Dehalococcoidia bacterium]